MNDSEKSQFAIANREEAQQLELRTFSRLRPFMTRNMRHERSSILPGSMGDSIRAGHPLPSPSIQHAGGPRTVGSDSCETGTKTACHSTREFTSTTEITSSTADASVNGAEKTAQTEQWSCSCGS